MTNLREALSSRAEQRNQNWRMSMAIHRDRMLHIRTTVSFRFRSTLAYDFGLLLFRPLDAPAEPILNQATKEGRSVTRDWRARTKRPVLAPTDRQQIVRFQPTHLDMTRSNRQRSVLERVCGQLVHHNPEHRCIRTAKKDLLALQSNRIPLRALVRRQHPG